MSRECRHISGAVHTSRLRSPAPESPAPPRRKSRPARRWTRPATAEARRVGGYQGGDPRIGTDLVVAGARPPRRP